MSFVYDQLFLFPLNCFLAPCRLSSTHYWDFPPLCAVCDPSPSPIACTSPLPRPCLPCRNLHTKPSRFRRHTPVFAKSKHTFSRSVANGFSSPSSHGRSPHASASSSDKSFSRYSNATRSGWQSTRWRNGHCTCSRSQGQLLRTSSPPLLPRQIEVATQLRVRRSEPVQFARPRRIEPRHRYFLFFPTAPHPSPNTNRPPGRSNSPASTSQSRGKHTFPLRIRSTTASMWSEHTCRNRHIPAGRLHSPVLRKS